MLAGREAVAPVIRPRGSCDDGIPRRASGHGADAPGAGRHTRGPFFGWITGLATVLVTVVCPSRRRRRYPARSRRQPSISSLEPPSVPRRGRPLLEALTVSGAAVAAIRGRLSGLPDDAWTLIGGVQHPGAQARPAGYRRHMCHEITNTWHSRTTLERHGQPTLTRYQSNSEEPVMAIINFFGRKSA